jgi:hypothetical protein
MGLYDNLSVIEPLGHERSKTRASYVSLLMCFYHLGPHFITLKCQNAQICFK